MRTVTLAVLILALLARWTTAEINAADTIEWVTADSDAVVVGKVSDVTTRVVDGATYYDVTLKVSETIKGPSRQSLKLAMRVYSGELPTAYKARGAELLVFVVDPRRKAPDTGDKVLAAAALNVRYSQGVPAIYDLAKPARAYTTAFGVIDKRDELLATVRAAAKSTASKAFRVDAVWDSPAQKALYSGSTVWLYLPVDSTLEPIAWGWLASTNVELRESGVAALASFPSDANAKRLVTLLADPGYASHDNKKLYLVRKQAHDVLTAWGVKHAKPVIETP